MPRFVILYHEMPVGDERSSHWDFMLQQGATLRTWALDAAPELDATVHAVRLPNHRLHYLDYEGPVSGERGTVTRWDSGQYVCSVDEPSQLDVELTGQRLLCVARFRQGPDSQTWTVSFSAT